MSHSPPPSDSHSTTAYKDASKRFLSGPRSHGDDTKSWRAPTTMLCALILGFGIAVGQHFMYLSLDNQPVSAVRLSQAWVSRISTGLAFSAKVALTLCVGIAYIQHQWLRLQQKPFEVREVNTLTGVVSNIFCLLESTVWYQYPILALMALITWTLPLSAIVTPGALSVEPVRLNTTIPLQVPQPLYNFTNYGTTDILGDTIAGSARLTKLLAYTASSQNPIRLDSLFQNQTYSLSFNAPALKCSSANDSVIFNSSKQYGQFGYDTQFASWVPDDPRLKIDSLDMPSPNETRIFVMTNTGKWGKAIEYKGLTGSKAVAGKVNVTECLLYNATYDIDFRFQYPSQSRTLSISQWLNPVSTLPKYTMADGIPTDRGTVMNPSDTNSYLSMMSTLGKLLIGTSKTDHYNTVINNGTQWGIVTIDWSEAEAVHRGLESLFQNFTLSLLSDPGFIKNSSNAALIPVEVETWPITYVYSPTDLVIAYGLSFFAAIVFTGIGLRAFFANDASYQNMFSTYLRATNDAGLSMYIYGNDAGEDPLPKTLGEARVEIGQRNIVR